MSMVNGYLRYEKQYKSNDTNSDYIMDDNLLFFIIISFLGIIASIKCIFCIRHIYKCSNEETNRTIQDISISIERNREIQEIDRLDENRLSEDRLGEDRLGEDRLGESDEDISNLNDKKEKIKEKNEDSDSEDLPTYAELFSDNLSRAQ